MAKKKKGDHPDAIKRENPLQAVLLADSFTNTFRPLSLDKPKVISPLNNVALIDYAMDFLAGAGVEELFVVCVSDRVATYVDQNTSTWIHTMQVTVIKDSSLLSAGDALRELDRQNLVQSDPFILMFADVVTNVNLSQVLKEHKERHKSDSSAIMTLLLKQVGSASEDGKDFPAVRSSTDDLIVGMDPYSDNRVLVYHDSCTEKNIKIPCSFFSNHLEVEIHTDLMDCGIYICSPDVLMRFTDEFDFNDVQKKFIQHSVAEEEEGLQNRIHAHVMGPSEYAARVHDFATYAAVSKDLLRRWCYPIVPDNLPSGYEKDYRYEMKRHYLYYERKGGRTHIGRTTNVHGPGMIGSHCFLDEGCEISGSVIGSQCHFAEGVTVRDSFVWDNVEIQKGATVIQSILADGAVIKAGAVISRGCVVGSGCVVGENVTLPEFTRLTLKEEEEDDFGDGFDDEEEIENDKTAEEDPAQSTDKDLVGPDGLGHSWVLPHSEDEENEDMYGMNSSELLKSQSIGYDRVSMFVRRFALQAEKSGVIDSTRRIDSTVFDENDDLEADSTSDPTQIIGRQKGVDVIKELKNICLEYEESSPIENLAIELNSFKFSQNASYSDCTKAATLAILEKMNVQKNLSDAKLLVDFKAQMERWSPLLRKLCIGLDEETSIIYALEQVATDESDIASVIGRGVAFRILLQTLHDSEVLSDESILIWCEDRRESNGEESPAAHKLFNQKPIQDFLEWLEEESESEDEDDEESGDESED